MLEIGTISQNAHYECKPANTLGEDNKETLNKFSMFLNKEFCSLFK